MSRFLSQRAVGLVVILVPAVVEAQASAPATASAEPPPLHLSGDSASAPEPGHFRLSTFNWWDQPQDGGDLPRWRISEHVMFETSHGVRLSAGFSGRRGDPLPLYL